MLGMYELPKRDCAELRLRVSGDVLGGFVEENEMVALVDEDCRLGGLGQRAEFVLTLEQRFVLALSLAQVTRDALHPYRLSALVDDPVVHLHGNAFASLREDLEFVHADYGLALKLAQH